MPRRFGVTGIFVMIVVVAVLLEWHRHLLHPALRSTSPVVHHVADGVGTALILAGFVAVGWSYRARMKRDIYAIAPKGPGSGGANKSLLEMIPYPLFVLSDGVIVFANDAFAKSIGIASGREAIGIRLGNVAAREEDRERIEALEKGEPIYFQEVEARTPDGDPAMLEYSAVPISYKGKKASLVIARNVTAQRLINKQLETARRQLGLTLDRLDAGIWTYDIESDAMVSCSDRLEGLLGVRIQRNERMSPELWERLYGTNRGTEFAEDWRAIAEAGTVSRDITLDGEGGAVILNSRISAVRDEKGRTFRLVGIVLDITDRVKNEERAQYLAYHDDLTGLPNRRLFKERLESFIARARASGDKVALAYIDLDRFKNINDSLGHRAGDLLLGEVASRLRKIADGSAFVARLSGDEFTIIMDNFVTTEVLIVKMSQILAKMNKPFTLDGKEYFVKGSMGIAVFPDHAQDMDGLMLVADSALYQAKQTRNTLRLYSAKETAERGDLVRLQQDLHRAISGGELMLHYQPKYEIRTRRIVGSEALLRWIHPELGFVPPDSFIPIAEDIGLMNELGVWVMRNVCRQIRDWSARGIRHPVSVNLSVKQFREGDVVAVVRRALEDTGIDPSLLELEITESIAMDIDKMLGTLYELNRLGVIISIDDFGTGYSSLSYLKKLPVHQLKIDKSFIRELGKDKGDDAIVSTIVTLAHNMQLKVVAEGVETEEQLELLDRYDCDEAQGYYFQRPIPVERLEPMLQPELDRNEASQPSGAKVRGIFIRTVLGSLIEGGKKFPGYQRRIAEMKDDEWYSWDLYAGMLQDIAKRVSPKAVRDAGRLIVHRGKSFFVDELGYHSLDELLRDYQTLFDRAIEGVPEHERARVISYEPGRVVLLYTKRQPQQFNEGVLVGFFELFDTPIRSLKWREYDQHYYEFTITW